MRSVPPSIPLHASAAPTRGQAAFALAVLLGLQPIATDAYLPALPALTRALAAPMSAAQLTMAGLMLAFGLAQLVWGPVADRFGRRPVLLAGLALYTVAATGGTLAGDIQTLVIWRVVQGVALAASVVCARAMVRDLYEPLAGAHVMSLALSGLALAAIGAPALGGFATAHAGWRAALAIVAVGGAGALAYVAWRVPETLRQADPRATHWASLARNWLRMGRHPVFVAWTLLVACSYGGLFTLLAASSFVYIGPLGFTASAYGLALAAGAASYLLGTFLCRQLVARHGMAGAVARAGVITLLAGTGMLVVGWLDRPAAWAVLGAHMLFSAGHGVHQPCAQAGVTGPFPHAAGTAAALAGFVLSLVAFAVGHWLGWALDGSVRPMAWGVAFWSLCTTALAWSVVPRATRPA